MDHPTSHLTPQSPSSPATLSSNLQFDGSDRGTCGEMGPTSDLSVDQYRRGTRRRVSQLTWEHAEAHSGPELSAGRAAVPNLLIPHGSLQGDLI
ncbi:hypothetical protein DPEC_G00005310 [Dallia pectoralis]|uniref:Uncharacterized protein n=1 Tax=Dallia pectoralis TaxID=75939 RepID=A0ACC2HKT7_DALPE|nr:hypothetical protein DPEC_G00005310 [Dallia pectoralis]